MELTCILKIKVEDGIIYLDREVKEEKSGECEKKSSTRNLKEYTVEQNWEFLRSFMK